MRTRGIVKDASPGSSSVRLEQLDEDDDIGGQVPRTPTKRSKRTLIDSDDDRDDERGTNGAGTSVVNGGDHTLSTRNHATAGPSGSRRSTRLRSGNKSIVSYAESEDGDEENGAEEIEERVDDQPGTGQDWKTPVHRRAKRASRKAPVSYGIKKKYGERMKGNGKRPLRSLSPLSLLSSDTGEDEGIEVDASVTQQCYELTAIITETTQTNFRII